MSDRALAFGLLLSGSQPLPKTIQVVTRADELGFEALWYADEKFYRDPYVGLTVAATHTRRVRIGTGVTDPYSRHPALTAMAAATLDEIAEGRVVVGLGAGGSGFPPMGISRTKPIFAVREAVDLMRRLWRGEVVNAHGEVISFVNGRLNFTPRRASIPIYVAARGKHMLRLAGEVADGVIVAPYASPPGLHYALEQIVAGAQRAGRDSSELDVVARVDVCIAPDRATALTAARRWVALPLWSSYPNWDYLDPLPALRVPERAREILATRDYSRIEEAAQYIPDEFAEHLVVAGTLSQVIEQVRAIAMTGVTQITIHPVLVPGQEEDELLEQFSKHVMPAARAAAAAAA